MKGFHAEEGASQLGICPPHSAPNSLVVRHSIFPALPKQEGLSDSVESPQISCALQALNLAEESPACKLPDYIYGGVFDPSAEISTLNFDSLRSLAAPTLENQITQENGSSGGVTQKKTTGGDGKREAEAICISRAMSDVFFPDCYLGSEEEEEHAQASMAASLGGANFDHVGELKGFVNGNDEAQMRTLPSSRYAPARVEGHGGREAEHDLRNRCFYINDLQASMAACEPLPGDAAFWRLLHSHQEKYSMDLVCFDDFCMYEFKVRRCMRGRSHDWTECPFAHPGEKARRRDPRCYNYSGAPCPDYRKGICRKGDSCELSHGVFECWLHPARYRTQPCKDGKACKRRVCFFAHSPSQLRLVAPDPFVSHEQLPLSGRPPSLTRPADGAAGYSDPPFRGPPSLKSQAIPGGAGHGIMGFFDELSRQSMLGFRTDGIQDAIAPITAHSRSLARGPEIDSGRNSYQGISIDDLSALLRLNSNQDRSHGCFSVADGQHVIDPLAYDGRKGHGFYSSSRPRPSTLESANLEAETNFRNHLALAGLKGSLDQLLSPTSTLMGHHVFSPPHLSPPLSPAGSPPASPSVAFSTWNCALSRKRASFAGVHPLSYDAFLQSPTIGDDGMRSSTTSSYLPNITHGSSVCGPSPLSFICDGDQTQGMDALDGLQKTVSIQTESEGMPAEPGQPMMDLISMLEELKCAGMVDLKTRKRCPSLLQRIHSPKASHGGEGRGAHAPSSFLMHESKQGLKNRLNGKLPKEEMDNLDLGWVNELVK